MYHQSTVPLVVVPASSLTLYEAAPTLLNPNLEEVVDIMFGTDEAVNLVATLLPGQHVGDELILRVIRRASHIVGGVEVSNKANLSIKVMQPGSLLVEQNYKGFGENPTSFVFPAFTIDSDFAGPQFALFRWTGVSWLPVAKNLPTA